MCTSKLAELKARISVVVPGGYKKIRPLGLRLAIARRSRRRRRACGSCSFSPLFSSLLMRLFKKRKNLMETKPFKLAFAAGLVMAIFYSAWTLYLQYWPREALRTTGKLIHLKGLLYLKNFLHINLKTTLEGAIYLFLFVFVFVLLTALIYRFLVGRKKRDRNTL